MQPPAADGSCPSSPRPYVKVTFKAGDRYDESLAGISICVPTLGFDNATNIYKVLAGLMLVPYSCSAAQCFCG
mgnify:CR=1 FL=1